MFFHKRFIFTQKKTNEKWTKISFLKILGEKYEYFRRQFDFSGLATHFLQ
jgi:hypothetical protein